MGVQLFTNGASSTLSGTLSQGGTTMTLAAGTGSKFPSITGSDFFLVTLFTKDVGGVEQNIEVVKVTARVGDTLTIVRDFENITGQSGGFAYDGVSTTVYVHLRWTAASANAMVQKGSSVSDLAFLQAGAGATARTALSKLQESVSVKDFGAVGDGTTDDTAAIQAALDSSAKLIFVPIGNYKTTATLTISASGVTLAGVGAQGGLGNSSTITSSAAGPAINVATGLTGVAFFDLSVSRPTGTAVAGYDGIKYTELTEQARVSNVRLTRHWVGLSLCATSYSYVTEVFASNNYSHGVQVANNANYAGLQWSFNKCLSQTNDGYGLYYTTASGVAPASVGDISAFFTYANKLGGAKFAGTAASPINAIRWFGGFVGEDGGHGLELDTYGSSSHKIDGLFAELAGVSPCGVAYGTAATHVGIGIKVTANNTSVELIACEVVGNSYTGIEMSASRFLITGCNTRINGAAAVGGQRNGIRCLAGEGSVVACSSKGHTNFGIYFDVGTVSVVGNDVRENGTALAGSLGASPVIGNNGSTVVHFGSLDTGWTAMTGTGDKATAYATSTVTLAQLAGRVKQMQDALMAMKILST